MSLVRVLYALDDCCYSNNFKDRLMRFSDNFRNLKPPYFVYTNDDVMNEIMSRSYSALVYDLGLSEELDFPLITKVKDLRPNILLIGLSLSMNHHIEVNRKNLSCFDELVRDNIPSGVLTGILQEGMMGTEIIRILHKRFDLERKERWK